MTKKMTMTEIDKLISDKTVAIKKMFDDVEINIVALKYEIEGAIRDVDARIRDNYR